MQRKANSSVSLHGDKLDNVIISTNLDHLTLFTHPATQLVMRTFEHESVTETIAPDECCKIVDLDPVWGEKAPSMNVHLNRDEAERIMRDLAEAFGLSLSDGSATDHLLNIIAQRDRRIDELLAQVKVPDLEAMRWVGADECVLAVLDYDSGKLVASVTGITDKLTAVALVAQSMDTTIRSQPARAMTPDEYAAAMDAEYGDRSF